METRAVLLWIPRVMGIAVAGFLSVFALDAFGHGAGLGVALADFAIHLIPAALVACVVAVAWRRPALGGLMFLLFALAYAAFASNHPSWVLTISGPLAVVGALFFLSARRAIRT